MEVADTENGDAIITCSYNLPRRSCRHQPSNPAPNTHESTSHPKLLTRHTYFSLADNKLETTPNTYFSHTSFVQRLCSRGNGVTVVKVVATEPREAIRHAPATVL